MQRLTDWLLVNGIFVLFAGAVAIRVLTLAITGV